MTDLSYLLFYLVISCGIVLLGRLPGMGWFRDAMNSAANRSTRGLAEAGVIARLGQRRGPETALGQTHLRATIGLRLLSTGLVGALLWFVVRSFYTRPGAFVAREHEAITFVVFVLLAGYYLAFIWSYRLRLADGELSVPTFAFGRRTFDLRLLSGVRGDGAYALHLDFLDGRRAEILKFVENRAVLEEELRKRIAGAATR